MIQKLKRLHAVCALILSAFCFISGAAAYDEAADHSKQEEVRLKRTLKKNEEKIQDLIQLMQGKGEYVKMRRTI